MTKVFAEKSSGKKSLNVAQNVKRHKISGPALKHPVAELANRTLMSGPSSRLGMADHSMRSFTVPLAEVQRKSLENIFTSHLPLADALNRANAGALEIDEALASGIPAVKGGGKRMRMDEETDEMNRKIGAKPFTNGKDKPDMMNEKVIAHEQVLSNQQIGAVHRSGLQISPANSRVVQCKGPYFYEIPPDIMTWLSLDEALQSKVKEYVDIPYDNNNYGVQRRMLVSIREHIINKSGHMVYQDEREFLLLLSKETGVVFDQQRKDLPLGSYIKRKKSLTMLKKSSGHPEKKLVKGSSFKPMDAGEKPIDREEPINKEEKRIHDEKQRIYNERQRKYNADRIKRMRETIAKKKIRDAIEKTQINEDEKPVTKDKKPIDEDVKSITKDKKPIDEDVKPITKDKKPIDEDVKPINEDKNPIDEDDENPFELVAFDSKTGKLINL
ncbi:MAG: hypothetical protein EHM14_08595 [Methanothrix sp.]|nr:MAG: hypothetical protein EHM14_08595 [Methanothrix sp.]